LATRFFFPWIKRRYRYWEKGSMLFMFV